MANQRGFALIELLFAAAVMLLIALWSTQSLMNRINDASAQQNARWMLGVRTAVLGYMEQQDHDLRHATASSDLFLHGYQNWANPQLAELKAAGLLEAGFPERLRQGGGVQISILRTGDCPGDDCRLSAFMHSLHAFEKSQGVVDEQMLARWLLATEGLGGIVHPSRPDTVSGYTFQYPNPVQGGIVLPAGTVAMAISDNQLAETAYLRVGDTRDPQFQSDASIAGNITAGKVISAGDYLHLGSTAQWLEPCAVDGGITRSTSSGLLVCKDGFWDVAARSGGGYSMNSQYGCFTPEGRSSANPITKSCSCPAEYKTVPISEGGADDSGRGITRGYLCVH